ncbi:hypothetical protein [Deinococcus detaillensis]|uniref:hypothetical protein n=1 Tax=Deinococcus detaillensis TaxID=2592048 RepID=UPI00163D6AB5|nr:hypothetical protein [Deinococcus detaillensis]
MDKSNRALLLLVCFLVAGLASVAIYIRGREVFWLAISVVYVFSGLAIYLRVRRR